MTILKSNESQGNGLSLLRGNVNVKKSQTGGDASTLSGEARENGVQGYGGNGSVGNGGIQGDGGVLGEGGAGSVGGVVGDRVFGVRKEGLKDVEEVRVTEEIRSVRELLGRVSWRL